MQLSLNLYLKHVIVMAYAEVQKSLGDQVHSKILYCFLMTLCVSSL